MEMRLTGTTEAEKLNNVAPVSISKMERKTMGKIASIFTRFTKKKSDTDFAKYLKHKFGEELAQRVLDTFDKINMPISTEGIQYLKSNEGCVDFKNKYDEVIHVEPNPPGKNYVVVLKKTKLQ